MSDRDSSVSLSFFRATPREMIEEPPLASSLQTFETTLFLIGMDRYPAALVSCATACESVIKAKLKAPPVEFIRHKELMRRIGERVPALQIFENDLIKAFQDTRNRFVHYGFSPQDDSESVKQLLTVGFPFLRKLYRDLYDFHLDWRSVRPGITDFMEMTKEESARVGLLPWISNHIYNAEEVYRRALQRGHSDVSYCIRGLAHYMLRGIKDAATSHAEWGALESSDNNGSVWDAQREVKERLEKAMGYDTWTFDCPICEGAESLVVELDVDTIADPKIAVRRGACAQCGFPIYSGETSLSEVLLESQLLSQSTQILREFGVDKQ